MVPGKLPVPGRPTIYSRARAYCACSGSGGVVWTFFSLVYHFSVLTPSLWERARYRLTYCLKGPLTPNQPTNEPTYSYIWYAYLLSILRLMYTYNLFGHVVIVRSVGKIEIFKLPIFLLTVLKLPG